MGKTRFLDICVFHKLIKPKYLCQRVFCGNQSRTGGGGGGGEERSEPLKRGMGQRTVRE